MKTNSMCPARGWAIAVRSVLLLWSITYWAISPAAAEARTSMSMPGQPRDPRTDLTISVQASVAYDSLSQLYTYSYTITNDSHSVSSLESFGLAPIEYASSITSPAHWSGFDRWESRIDAVVWSVTDNPASLPPDSLDTGNIPPNAYCTPPGQQITGFTIVSRQPPGTVTWYAQGEDTLLSVEEEPYEEILTSDDGFFGLVSVQGTTTGPDISSPTGVAVKPDGTTRVARLFAPSPNPSGGNSIISFELAKEGRARLEVVDVQGRHVLTLGDGWRGAGKYSMEWKGVDDRGTRVAAGVYFVRLVIDDAVRASRRFVMVR